MKKLTLLGVAILGLLGFGWLVVQKVGEQPDGKVLVATGQIVQPVGTQIPIPGRPIGLVLSKDGETLFVKENRGLSAIDLSSNTILDTLRFGTSLVGLALDASGDVWVTDAASGVRQVRWAAGKLSEVAKIELPEAPAKGPAYPCGIVIGRSGRAYVALSRSNQVAVLDLVAKKVVSSFPVDICPFDVAVSPDESEVWVSCWGGEPPEKGEKSQDSAGTEVEIEDSGVAHQATVVRLDLKSKDLKRFLVGLQPSELLLTNAGRRVIVACANDDTISIIDDGNRQTTVVTKPELQAPFGSVPNGLALSDDGTRLFVSNGGTNSVAVIDLGLTRHRLVGHIPAGWYPTGMAVRGNRLYVANAKGTGSREKQKDGSYGVYGFTGSITAVDVPTTIPNLWTEMTKKQARLPEAVFALAPSERDGAKPTPVPAKVGDPSPIKHIVYFIKENRTYDQVLGDMKQGDGDPKLCSFPREVSPNHHALAEEFVLLDNYYCNGVLSADGHAWSVEGNATSYFERTFGGWTRSYPFGDDPLAVSKTGFLWDHVLAAGLSFRNFGEFDYAEAPKGMKWLDVYRAFQAGKALEFGHKINIERLRRYSHEPYPGWNMGIPDVVRADIFLKEFARWKEMPSLTIIHLPQDHTSGDAEGQPTPRACVADNDLALGQIVSAISKSKFWKNTVIFAIEDDPQAGYDHVDGHRSLCLIASPYAKRGAVVKSFHNQTSLLHTMTRILGIPPMNQMTASMTPMSECFTDKPDFRPYEVRPNQIALDEMNAKKDKAEELDFSKPDMSDEDTLNRIIWAANHPGERYPKEMAGAHGKGLGRRGLQPGAR